MPPRIGSQLVRRETGRSRPSCNRLLNHRPVLLFLSISLRIGALCGANPLHVVSWHCQAIAIPPSSCPSLFVTHADQSPYPLHRHPRNRHPFLLSPRLAFHPPMRKGAAPKRDPFRAGISLQFVTHPSLIRSGLLQAWPRTSWRHHSFPPHRRSYPRCRIGGIRLRQASRAAPRGAASRCSRRRTARFGCRGR